MVRRSFPRTTASWRGTDEPLTRYRAAHTPAYAGEAVCAPSRCTLMTGQHTGHAYIRGNDNVDGHDLPLPADTVTVADVLKTAGYWTGGHVGVAPLPY